VPEPDRRQGATGRATRDGGTIVSAEAAEALEPACTGEDRAVHKARAFGSLPDPSEALALLADLATAPCAFGPVRADRALALYGGGDFGHLARDVLTAVGHNAVMVVDRNATALASDPYWRGVKLLHPDAVPDEAKRQVRLAVSIVTSPYIPIERQLLDLGFDDVVPFYDLAESFRAVHPLSNGWFAPPLTQQDQDATARVLTRWDDDLSRADHLQFLAWRRLREEWTFTGESGPRGNRYFIPEVAACLYADETFLDGGAYHGTVVQAFADQTRGAFKRVIAVEPDPTSRATLHQALRPRFSNDSRLTVLDCALGEHQETALFHDGLGYASQLSRTGRMQVAVRPLDALDLAPGFLKLHLEGGELPALKGARQTLLAHRPIIAATVYHNADGLWQTPLWLMETLSNYRFLFRAHSWCGTGAVVYGIPAERRI
jgi:FkbM family methyltransferase